MWSWAKRRGRTAARRIAFERDYRRFCRGSRTLRPGLPVPYAERRAFLHDHTSATSFDRHYVYHTAWAARKLAEIRPAEHIDIGSSLFFSAIVSSTCKIVHLDFRPPQVVLENLAVGAADLGRLSFEDASIDSLSCMHVVEHIGLGRYGDRLEPDGDIKACNELQRVLAIDGDLLFVVPVGRPRVVFNAHRVYSYTQVLELLSELKLVEFALVPDDSRLPLIYGERAVGLCAAQEYGCGCFHFVKRG